MLVGAVLGAPQALSAPPVDVSGGLSVQTIADRSFDLVASQDQLTQIDLNAALRPFPGLRHVWIELGYVYGRNSAGLHQSETASLDDHGLSLSLLYRRRIFTHLGWLIRAGPTVDIGHLAMSDGQGNELAGQWKAEPGVEGALGVEVPFFEADRDGLPGIAGAGFRLDVGYRWQPGFTFDHLTAPAAAHPSPLATQPLAVGTLATAGPVVRGTLFVRF